MRKMSGVGFVLGLVVVSACHPFTGDDSRSPPTTNGDDAGDAGTDSQDASESDTGVPPVGDDGIALQVMSTEQRIVQGKTLPISVKLVRGAHATGPANVTVTGLRAGVSASTSILDGTDGSLVLTATKDVSQGVADAVVEATLGDKHVTAPLHLFVRGPKGSSDTTFGDNGYYRDTDDGSLSGNLLVKSDDSIFVLRGSTGTRHLSADGKLDTSYGNAGLADDNSFGNFSTQVALLSDGGLLFIGRGRTDHWAGSFGKLDAKGHPDVTFGDGKSGVGKSSVPANAGGKTGIGAIALWPDDEWTFIANSPVNSPTDYIFVNVFDAAGKSKSTFGTEGVVNVSFQLPQTQANIPLKTSFPSLSLLKNGDILVSGTGVEMTMDDSPKIKNYYSVACQLKRVNGAFNPWFGSDGCVVKPNLGETDLRSSASELPDGTIRMSVYSSDGGMSWTYAMDAKGAPLTSVGNQGLIGPVTQPPSGDPNAQWQPFRSINDGDGSLLVESSRSQNGLVESYRFRRVLKSGDTDLSFGNAGIVAIDNHFVDGVSFYKLTQMAQQSDGRILFRGNNVPLKYSNGMGVLHGPMFVVRYWN